MGDIGTVLFVYERPEHTRKVLTGLEQNDIDHLYVFADGPRPDDDREAIQETRSVVHDIDFCETEIIEREENWGIIENTLDGIEYVFDRHDQLVMLEDDDVPTPDFMTFMQRCLDEYDDNPEVMQVSGYTPPIYYPPDYEYDVYFSYRGSSWGWGTWKHAWKHYERDREMIEEWLASDPEGLCEVLDKAGEDLFPRFKHMLAGEVNSWSTWWALAIAKHGVAVNPIESRIQTIGFDGTGEHCHPTDKFAVSLHSGRSTELRFPPTVEVHEQIHQDKINYITAGRVDRAKLKTKWRMKQLLHALP